MKNENASDDAESRIIESFSRHARGYDRYAHLQSSMAERLASLLPDPFPARVLEIGCGTGIFTRHLLVRRVGKLVLNDIAPAMIDLLKTRLTLPESAKIVLGNAERLRFQKVDLIAANAVFQWFREPGKTLERLAGCLSPGGRIVFSTFGPATLKEFRETAQLESPTTLHSLSHWKRLLIRSGFTVVEAHSETRQTFHPSALALMKNLQQIGAAPFRMIRPGVLRKALREYDTAFTNSQGVYASWELLYLSASLSTGEK